MPALQELKALFDDPTVVRVVIAIFGVALILIVRALVNRALLRRVDDGSTRYRTRKLLQFGSYVVVVLLVSAVFSDKLGSLTVALGVAGAGVAFALQEVIASVAGWLGINFAGFYRVGDRVRLGGIRGDVIDVGVLRTTLFEVGDWVDGDLYNGRVVRLANSFVFKEPVFNYSAEFPFLWDEVRVPVRHGSDRDLAQSILEEVGETITGGYAREVQKTWDKLTRHYVIEKARVEPLVTLVADENWTTFTLRYVTDFKRRRGTKDAIWRAILSGFDQSEGRVSLASAAQEITVMPPSTIRVDADPGTHTAHAAR